LQNDRLWEKTEKAEATRSSSGEVIQIVKDAVPNLFGGSADLAPSTKTEMKGEGFFSKENRLGKNIHFGVRELAMAGIANGILLHGGYRSFASTFFVFSDYIKPMLRLSALMKIPQIFVLTHDSIGVGEDGPTHEPIEQLAMLRSTPNCRVFRPADRLETAAAWFSALSSTDCPTAIVLSRQNLPQLCPDGKEALKGAYILSGAEPEPEMIFIATGSELGLAEEAAEELRKEGKRCTLVEGGNLAGSVSNVFDCMKTAVQSMKIPFRSAILASTINPAKALGVEKTVGSISVGKKADYLLLDNALNLKAIYQSGKALPVK